MKAWSKLGLGLAWALVLLLVVISPMPAKADGPKAVSGLTQATLVEFGATTLTLSSATSTPVRVCTADVTTVAITLNAITDGLYIGFASNGFSSTTAFTNLAAGGSITLGPPGVTPVTDIWVLRTGTATNVSTSVGRTVFKNR